MGRTLAASILALLWAQDGGDAAAEKAKLHEELAAAAEGIGDQLIKSKWWDEARAFLELIRAKSDARGGALDQLIAKTEKQTSGLKWDAKASDLVKAFGAERAKGFFAFAKAWRGRDAEAARWTEAEAEILDDLLDYVKAYARLTQVRSQYELPKTRFDWKLSVPAVWHAKYKLLNSKHSVETEGSPGYTPEGRRTGAASITSPDESLSELLEGLVHTPFHRNYILHPSLAHTGLGQAKATGYTAVIDVKTGLLPSIKSNSVLCIPRDGSSNVPRTGYDDHIRMVDGKSMKDLGYPVSVVFFDPDMRPINVNVSLTERMRNVELYLSTPESPTVPKNTPYIKHTILATSTAPLKAEMEYRVLVKFEIMGEKRVLEWSFKTGR